MIYGTTFFDTVQGSTSITTQKQQEARHIPYTNINIVINKGQFPTTISTTILATTEEEKNKLMAILNTETHEKLYIGDFYYQDVVPGESANPVPLRTDHKEKWTINATFIALDPVPYNTEPEEAL